MKILISFKCSLVSFHASMNHRFTDSKEPLVPPRFLEKFCNRTVKQGASITLSVKVEGAVFALLTFYMTSIWLNLQYNP